MLYMSDYQEKRQGFQRRHWLSWTLLLLVVMSCGACGKKAGHLYPPEGVKDDHFPRAYPDIATDPKPDADPQ